MTEKNSLYNLLGCKRKNSVLKSAFYAGKTIEGYSSIEVEPWDNTGYKALNTTPKKYDDTLKTIENALVKLYKKLPHTNKKECLFYISVFGLDDFEYIFNPETRQTY